MLILSRCNHCLRGPQNQLLLASAAVLVSEERGGNVSKIHFGFKPGYGSNCKPYWLWRIAAKYTILCAGYGNPRVFRKIESFAVHATATAKQQGAFHIWSLYILLDFRVLNVGALEDEAISSSQEASGEMQSTARSAWQDVSIKLFWLTGSGSGGLPLPCQHLVAFAEFCCKAFLLLFACVPVMIGVVEPNLTQMHLHHSVVTQLDHRFVEVWQLLILWLSSEEVASSHTPISPRLSWISFRIEKMTGWCWQVNWIGQTYFIASRDFVNFWMS